MSREDPNFREIVATLYERFKKDNLNAQEYAEYLGINKTTVTNLIKKKNLPGKPMGSSERPIYIIPIKSIALFEIECAKRCEK